MISKIKGKLIKKSENFLVLEVSGISYEVMVPMTVINNLKDKNIGEEIELITYYYISNEPSRSIPVLIGFSNQIEKDFFEKFITVSGVGPKGAVRALNEPISKLIQAIESSDLSHLKSLPGIGEQRAKQIIAKLQGKVGRFGLIKDAFDFKELDLIKGIKQEALEVLIQLQYKKHQAADMIEKVLQRNKNIKTTEQLLNEVYNQKKET